MANRLYAQYRDKTKASKLSEIPVSFRGQMLSVAEFVRDSWDIDRNSGEALNVIGRIVDANRSLLQTSYLTVYECNSDGDFECGDDSIQLSTPSVADDANLSDDYYQYLLKAKIAKNNSSATIDEILTSVNFIIGDQNAVATRLIDNEDMTFSIVIEGDINNVVRDLMTNGDIIPRPQGVTFSGFVEI